MKTSLDKDQPDFLEMQCWEGCGQHHPLPAREGILPNKPQHFQSYTMDDPITSTLRGKALSLCKLLSLSLNTHAHTLMHQQYSGIYTEHIKSIHSHLPDAYLQAILFWEGRQGATAMKITLSTTVQYLRLCTWRLILVHLIYLGEREFEAGSDFI